ncbi:MAG: TrmH family RNA methyltransferase [Candidatus Rokuibacteriota bacterium]
MKVEILDDPADPRAADYREPRDGQLRRRAGLFLAEGRLVVRRLLEASRFRIRSLLLTPRALDDLRDLLARDDAPPAYLASAATIRDVVGFKFHRGCLAAAVRGAPLCPEALIEPPGARALLALEELADPDNVGAVFRNAAAFGAAGVLLSPGCADPLYRKAIRVAMGATLSMPFARTDWRDGLERLRAAGYTLVALTPDRDAEDIRAVAGRGSPPRRLALLVGAEGPGLGASTRAAADRRVRIPMAAGADSLNVATACGIALHRLA